MSNRFHTRSAFLKPLLIALALVAGTGVADTAQRFEGPVEATVLSVLDGDTFLAEAAIWPGQFIRVNIRIRGIDAPEMKARCAAERDAALAARATLAGLLGQAPVRLSNIAGAKYFGRVLADVASRDGVAVAASMLDSGTVRIYRGGRRQSWCG